MTDDQRRVKNEYKINSMIIPRVMSEIYRIADLKGGGEVVVTINLNAEGIICTTKIGTETRMA